jgi:molybdopterin/thiamine biosynthesis adenylyltransferase
VLPGIVGTIQATEAIKVLLDIGDPLSGELLTFNTLEMEFRKLKIYRDDDCPICEEYKSETGATEPEPARTSI